MHVHKCEWTEPEKGQHTLGIPSMYVLLPFLLTQSLCFLNFVQLSWRDNSNMFSTNDNHRKLVKLGLNHSKLPNQSKVFKYLS